MYVDYVKTFLDSDERFSKTQKNKLADRIVKWAERNNVQSLEEIHTVLSDWIDNKPVREQFFIDLNKSIDENVSLVDLIEDPRALSPPQILVANEEGELLDSKELKDMVVASFPDIEQAVKLLLDCSDFTIPKSSIDFVDIEHRFRVLLPKINDGTLLHTGNQIIHVGFNTDGNLKIEYKRGHRSKLWIPIEKYNRDKVMVAIEMRLRGEKYGRIHLAVQEPPNKIGLWLRYASLGKIPKWGEARNIDFYFQRFEKVATRGMEGYADERFKKAVELRMNGRTYSEIAREVKINNTEIIGSWLRCSNQNFPKIKYHVRRDSELEQIIKETKLKKNK